MTKQYAYVCTGCSAIYWVNNLQCDCEVPSLMTFRRMIVTPAPEELWMKSNPPKRGVYRVRRVGKASTNYGYSYWSGERWGTMCSKRIWAQQMKDECRKTPSKYQMEWQYKGGAA